MKIKSILFVILAIMTSTEMSAQKLFTLEDLNFGGHNYRHMTPARASYTWWGDKLVDFTNVDFDLVDMKTGESTKMLLSGDLIREKALGINLADDGVERTPWMISGSFPYADKKLLFTHYKGKRHLIDFNYNLVWSQSTEGSLEWCKESKADAFLRGDNLWVRYADGEEVQLTKDGSREIVYGQAVHRNEFGIEKGTFWSPDGTKLAFYRMDQSMVTDYPQVNTFERSATYEPDKYPMAGMTSHKVTIGIFDLNTKKTIYLNMGDPTDRYFSNIQWAPDGKNIYLFELNRKQNDCTLDCYNASTGEKQKTLYRETSEKYVEPLHPITFLPWDASKFVYWSWKDGFTHLYLMDVNGNALKQLTSGQWCVKDLLGFDLAKKRMIITSKEKNDLQVNTYSVDINTGKRALLDNGIGVHRPVLSNSGKYVYDIYSAPDVPREYVLFGTNAEAPLSKRSSTLFTSPDPWKGYTVPIYENGYTYADDGTTKLYWRMVKPADFDPTKKYPTVVYVYGGPHAHNVEASWHWGSRSWETYMAQKGYILFILDNRGSEDRGRDFEQVTWHRLGEIEAKDQMKGVEYLKSLPYVDADRLGVHGWSFGGFMTTTLMTTYPDVFKVGVAGGPVIDWKWYEVMYGERYMGTPQDNPDGYANSSLIGKAKDLKGKLQIIIGMNDPTVVPQHALQFLNQCTIEGTQPDFFVYPGEGHNMVGHRSVHLHERITQYFEDYLK